MKKPLNFEIKSDATVMVQGCLDRSTVPYAKLPYKDALAGASQLNLDLQQLEKIDTSGLAWLIDLLSQLQQQEIRLKLHNLPEQLVKLMTLGHVDNLFE